MTDTHPAGLVTDEEAEVLADPDTGLDEHRELRDRVTARLRETLQDFSIVYPTLPADDIEAVFTAADGEPLAPIRAGTQDGIAFLVLGMLLGGDMLDMRLSDAIHHAGISYGEAIDVTVDLRRRPLPTIEQFAAQVQTDGLTDQTYALFEHFLSHPGTDPEILADIAAALDIDLTAEDKAEIHDTMNAFERAPQSVITNVSAVESTDDNLESDT